jgi:putative tricarboxylic transport membrane protein
MSVLDYIWLGILAVFQGPEAFSIFRLAISITVIMVISGFFLGILVGATPGLAGPVAMAISLPILISTFGYNTDALLPCSGIFNRSDEGGNRWRRRACHPVQHTGTPDAFMTTLDGYPMAKRGEAKRALRIAHFSSVSGDTFSDWC